MQTKPVQTIQGQSGAGMVPMFIGSLPIQRGWTPASLQFTAPVGEWRHKSTPISSLILPAYRAA